MEKQIGFFKKVFLFFWLVFNKKKYVEYIEQKDRKLYIYNKWTEIDGNWLLDILASSGELFQHTAIVDGKLDEAIQLFTQDIKWFYNDLEVPYEIINIFPEDKCPEGYVKAFEIWKEGYDPEAPTMYLLDLLTLEV